MYDPRIRGYVARCLADALLAGAWEPTAMVNRAGQTLDWGPPWLWRVVGEVLRAYHRPPADRPRELAQYIEITLGKLDDEPDEPPPPRIRRWLAPEPAMGSRRWPVAEIASLGALAASFGLSDSELSWMADTRGLERSVVDPRLRHYAYGTIPRRSGPVRVIERPKHRLKSIQRQILEEILNWIPAHDAAHGFMRGRSVLSHARGHVGQFVLMRFDLEDFFASIAAGRVYGIFRVAGYPESVAYSLTGLTTNVVPAAFWHAIPRPVDSTRIATHQRLGSRLATPHLPQGAPTSPALANLAAFGLDRRLHGLAASLDLTYSRYADDLTFSGSVRATRSADTLRRAVTEIVSEKGFKINEDKILFATRAGRQRVCGVVVNKRTNVAREEYDTLKAIIHNAVVHGPDSQNRDARTDFRAYLLGRIAWVQSLNPPRGEKLRAQFDRIVWADQDR